MDTHLHLCLLPPVDINTVVVLCLVGGQVTSAALTEPVTKKGVDRHSSPPYPIPSFPILSFPLVSTQESFF